MGRNEKNGWICTGFEKILALLIKAGEFVHCMQSELGLVILKVSSVIYTFGTNFIAHVCFWNFNW